MFKPAWAESRRFKLHGRLCLCARTGKEGGASQRGESRTGAESEHVTYLRHYLSLLLNLSVLSLCNARRNRAYLAQFTRVERDSALHCTANERRLCLFLRACPVCAAAVPLCLNRLLPGPLEKVGRHCLTFNLSVVRKDFISRI